jgi:hypothetical protein
MNAMPTYHVRKISDPRSRGACYWFEIEATSTNGARWHVATVDTRAEARELVAKIEADDARRLAEAASRAREAAYARLDAARRTADELAARRRIARARGLAGDLAAERLAAARELIAARAGYDAAVVAEFSDANQERRT